MKQLVITACSIFMLCGLLGAQTSLKLNYINNVPANIKTCGALYTYDTVAPAMKKYILLTDFQNLGLISINGKLTRLQLTDAKTINKSNVSTYTGAGYTVIVTTKTTGRKGKTDMETGTMEVLKGTAKLRVRMHGQSACDESKMEGNL